LDKLKKNMSYDAPWWAILQLYFSLSGAASHEGAAKKAASFARRSMGLSLCVLVFSYCDGASE
jgi:hypothetical protein